MALIERPYQYCFSKNEIRYVFELQDLERRNLVLQVKLLYAPMGAGDMTELITFVLKPSTDGMVYLYIQAYINSLLKYVLPNMNTDITSASEQCCRFTIHYRELDDNNSDPEWNTNETTHERIALKGGIEKHKASRNNIFINYIETQKPFLTWQPAGRFSFYDEPVFLTLFNPTLADFAVKVLIKATDGAEYESITNYAADALLYHINAGAAYLNLLGMFNKQIHYYEVSVLNTDWNETFASAYRMYIEHRPVYEFYDLIYHNSIGGIDMVRVSGETDLLYEKNSETGTAGLNVNDWNSSVKSAEQFYSSISLQRKYKGNIGLLKTRTKRQQDAYTELFVTKSIYMLTDGRWVPVQHVLKSSNLGSRKNATDGYPVEWELSESNEVYTPAYIIFGQGADTEDYTIEEPPPEIFTAEWGWGYEPFAATGGGSITEISNTNTGIGGTRTQQFQIGNNVPVGAEYTQEVYSHPVTVTAVTGDDAADIAIKLRDAINATTEAEWDSASSAPPSGTNGFKPTASATGDTVTVILDYQHSFAASTTTYADPGSITWSETADFTAGITEIPLDYTSATAGSYLYFRYPDTEALKTAWSDGTNSGTLGASPWNAITTVSGYRYGSTSVPVTLASGEELITIS